jgi:hypothetical protein
MPLSSKKHGKIKKICVKMIDPGFGSAIRIRIKESNCFLAGPWGSESEILGGGQLKQGQHELPEGKFLSI